MYKLKIHRGASVSEEPDLKQSVKLAQGQPKEVGSLLMGYLKPNGA